MSRISSSITEVYTPSGAKSDDSDFSRSSEDISDVCET